MTTDERSETGFAAAGGAVDGPAVAGGPAAPPDPVAEPRDEAAALAGGPAASPDPGVGVHILLLRYQGDKDRLTERVTRLEQQLEAARVAEIDRQGHETLGPVLSQIGAATGFALIYDGTGDVSPDDPNAPEDCQRVAHYGLPRTEVSVYFLPEAVVLYLTQDGDTQVSLTLPHGAELTAKQCALLAGMYEADRAEATQARQADELDELHEQYALQALKRAGFAVTRRSGAARDW